MADKIRLTIASIGSPANIAYQSGGTGSFPCSTNVSKDDVNLYGYQESDIHGVYFHDFYVTSIYNIKAGSVSGKKFIGWYSIPSDFDRTIYYDENTVYYYGRAYTLLVSREETLLIPSVSANRDIWKKTDGIVPGLSFMSSLAAVYRDRYSFTVTYAPGENGTGAQQTATKTEDSPLTLAGALFTRSGYTQTGWATSDGGAKAYDLAGSYTQDSAVTLYPVWTPNTYTVTLSDEHHEAETIEVTYDEAYGTLPSPVFAGYGFTGWYTAASGGTQVTEETVVSTAANHTLYARWEAETYTIVFHANGGTGTMSDIVFTYDATSALLPACGFEKTGNTCTGWSLTAGGDATYSSGVTSLVSIVDDLGGPSGPINLYAVWETAEYTVSFNSESYLGDPIPPITVRYGGTYGELPSVLMDGDQNYIFDGWFYGETEIKSGDRVRIASDIELSAQFHAKRVTILLDATSGGRWRPDTEGTQSVAWEYNGNRPSITLPVMADYEFLGYTTVVYPAQVYFDDGSVGDIGWDDFADGSTIKAVAEWIRERYTITLDSNGGSSKNPISASFHKFIGGIEPPTKTGYTFAGWSPRIPRFMPKANMTCTAQWSVNSYNVKYALVGGMFASDATVEESATFDTAFAVPAPSRSGYLFKGWHVTSVLDATTAMYGADASSVTTPIASESTLCSNIADGADESGTVYFKNLTAENGVEVVLTAVWEAVEYDLTFNPGGNAGYISYDPVAPTTSTAVKAHGVPYLLDGDNIPEYSTTSDDVDIVGWSTDINSQRHLAPRYSPCAYPTGVEYAGNANITLYPAVRQHVGAVWNNARGYYEHLVIPVIVTCNGISAVYMTKAGMDYRIDYSDIPGWCGTVSPETIIGWKFNDGVNDTTIYNNQSLTFHVDEEATSLTVEPATSENSGTNGKAVVYAYGALHPDGDIDDEWDSPHSEDGTHQVMNLDHDVTIGNYSFTRDGYVQVGWTDLYRLGGVTSDHVETEGGESVVKYEDATGRYFEHNDTYSKNAPSIVLYPVWERRQYDLSIDLDGGSFGSGTEALSLIGNDKPIAAMGGVAEIENIDVGDVIWIPRPSRSGYRFVGWVFKDTTEEPSSSHVNSVCYLARFRIPGMDAGGEDFYDVTEEILCGPEDGITESSLIGMPDVGDGYAGVLKDGDTQYRAGEYIAIRSVINVGRTPDADVTMKAVWRKNTKYRVRFNKVDSEIGNITFTTKEHELGEEWTLPKVGGETEERSGTEGDQDVTTELGWSLPGFRFEGWRTDYGEFTDGEKIVLGGDVEVCEDEIIDFSAAWEPIQSYVTFRTDDWQTETLEASGNVVDGLIGVAPASASRTMSDSPGKVDHGFILEPTETFTPQRTFGAKVFALVTDYVSQISVLLRDELLWTEKVMKDRSYLLSYASVIPVTAGYAYGNDRTMGAVKVNGKGVAIGDTTVSDGVFYSDEATFKAEPLGGYRFVGWYTSATELSDETLYSRAAETVVFIDDTNGISLYAKFAPEPNGIYRWEGSKQNKLMEWKSKVYVGSKPFNPAALRVDATGYPPVEVTVEMFSSPDADATATARLTNIVSQDSRRLPRLRPERYMQIGVKHDAEVDAIFVGTSMGGLAV